MRTRKKRATGDQAEGDKQARTHRLRSWTRDWRPDPHYLRCAVDKALEGLSEDKSDADDLRRRRALGDELYRLAVRVWQRQAISTGRKDRWHVGMRIFPAAAAVGAAAAGGTLIAGLTGTAGKVVGVIVVFLAILGTAGEALRLNSEFAYQVRRARDLEQIGWEIILTITQELREKSLDELSARIKKYADEVATTINREPEADDSKSMALAGSPRGHQSGSPADD